MTVETVSGSTNAIEEFEAQPPLLWQELKKKAEVWLEDFEFTPPLATFPGDRWETEFKPKAKSHVRVNHNPIFDLVNIPRPGDGRSYYTADEIFPYLSEKVNLMVLEAAIRERVSFFSEQEDDQDWAGKQTDLVAIYLLWAGGKYFDQERAVMSDSMSSDGKRSVLLPSEFRYIQKSIKDESGDMFRLDKGNEKALGVLLRLVLLRGTIRRQERFLGFTMRDDDHTKLTEMKQLVNEALGEGTSTKNWNFDEEKKDGYSSWEISSKDIALKELVVFSHYDLDKETGLSRCRADIEELSEDKQVDLVRLMFRLFALGKVDKLQVSRSLLLNVSINQEIVDLDQVAVRVEQILRQHFITSYIKPTKRPTSFRIFISRLTNKAFEKFIIGEKVGLGDTLTADEVKKLLDYGCLTYYQIVSDERVRYTDLEDKLQFISEKVFDTWASGRVPGLVLRSLRLLGSPVPKFTKTLPDYVLSEQEKEFLAQLYQIDFCQRENDLNLCLSDIFEVANISITTIPSEEIVKVVDFEALVAQSASLSPVEAEEVLLVINSIAAGSCLDVAELLKIPRVIIDQIVNNNPLVKERSLAATNQFKAEREKPLKIEELALINLYVLRVVLAKRLYGNGVGAYYYQIEHRGDPSWNLDNRWLGRILNIWSVRQALRKVDQVLALVLRGDGFRGSLEERVGFIEEFSQKLHASLRPEQINTKVTSPNPSPKAHLVKDGEGYEPDDDLYEDDGDDYGGDIVDAFFSLCDY